MRRSHRAGTAAAIARSEAGKNPVFVLLEASLRHVRLPSASAARVLAGIQALCCAVFRTGNTLFPQDYFLPAAPPQGLHFHKFRSVISRAIFNARMLTPSQA